jgi:hypothetical protein
LGFVPDDEILEIVFLIAFLQSVPIDLVECAKLRSFRCVIVSGADVEIAGLFVDKCDN